MNTKKYLGDSVYVELEEDGRIKLTTENGFSPSDTIYLDSSSYYNLIKYVEKLVEASAEEKADKEEKERDL